MVIVLLLSGLAMAEIARTPAWQEELDAYVADTNASTDQAVTIVSIQRARRPASFEPALSSAVHGEDAYSYRSLPFPPERVRCVLIEIHRPGAEPTAQVVFVALHQDLYNADWVVHEGPTEPFAQQFLTALTVMGCDLRLTDWQ